MRKMRKPEEYDSILHFRYPYLSSRKKMSPHDRAAQFSSFDALKGLDEELDGSAKLTETELCVDDDDVAKINDELVKLREESEPTVFLTYFVPDTDQSGGRYRTALCTVKKQDTDRRLLILQNGDKVPMKHISFLELQEKADCLF